MGAGASVNASTALSECTQEELNAKLGELSAEDLKRLGIALEKRKAMKPPEKKKTKVPTVWTVKRLEKAFKQFDKDGSGSIGFEEVTKVEKFFKVEASESQPAAWLDGKITFVEFVAWLKKAGVPVIEKKKETAKPITAPSIMSAFGAVLAAQRLKGKSGKDSDSIDTEAAQKIETHYKIPMEVTASNDGWDGGFITAFSFIGKLKAAGHAVKEKPAVPPPKVYSRSDLKKSFDAYDNNPKTENIGFEEVQAIEEFFNIPMSVSASADDWKDGVISFEEFVEWVKKAGHDVADPPKPTPAKPLTIDELRKAFDGFDGIDENKGKIGFEEVEAIEKFYNIPMSVSANAADWQDGVVSFEEFVEWVKKAGHAVEETPKPPAKLSKAMLEKAFKLFDKDGSGNIGFEEVQAIEQFYDIPMEVSARMTDWADGTISFDEFAQWVKDAGHELDEATFEAPGVSKADLQKMFDEYKGPTGKIGFGEVTAVEKAFQIPMEVSSKASDWADSSIDFDEFCSWLEKANPPIKVA